MVEKLMKAPEVAQVLGVSKSFAYQLVRQGIIPSLRLGKSVRIRPADLETYILNNVSMIESKSDRHIRPLQGGVEESQRRRIGVITSEQGGSER